VTLHRNTCRFVAKIKTHDQTKYLGLFIDQRDAAGAYDAAARLNFPDI